MSNPSFNLFFNIKMTFLYSAPILHLLGRSFATKNNNNNNNNNNNKVHPRLFPKTGYKSPKGE